MAPLPSLPFPSSPLAVIHGSDSPQSAQDEIAHWFKPEEVTSYRLAADVWVYEGRK